MAMVAILIGFAEIFKDFGVSAAVVQREKLDSLVLSTMFWCTVVTGGGIAMALNFLAPSIANFYDEPLLVNIVLLLAINFFLSSLTIIPHAMLIRDMAFRKLFYIALIAELAAASMAIWLALDGWGYWSLLGKIWVSTGLHLLLLWSFLGWRPRLRISIFAIKELMDFSTPLVGGESINYWVRHLDDLLIARFFGERAIGLYGKAYSFLTIPLVQIRGVVGRIALPVLSRLQDDQDQVRIYFLKITRMVALFSFPTFLGLYILSHDLIYVLLGIQWMEVVPLLQIFSLCGLLQSVVVLTGVLFISQGATALKFKVSLLTSSLGIAAILIGLNWGVEGIAWGLLIATMINLLPNVHFVGRLINMSFWDWLVNLKELFLCTIVMSFGMLLCQSLLFEMNIYVRFLILTITGGLIYLFVLKVLRVRALGESMSFIQKLITSRA